MELTKYRWSMVQVCIFLILVPILFPLYMHPFILIICFMCLTVQPISFLCIASPMITIACLFLTRLALILKMFFRRQSKNGLYPFPIQMNSFNKISPTGYVGERVSASIWHSCLVRPTFSLFHHLASASKLPVASTNKLPSVCAECQIGKSKKLPFSISSSTSSQPLDSIHCSL